MSNQFIWSQTFCDTNFGNDWGIYTGTPKDNDVFKISVDDTTEYPANDTVYSVPNLDSLLFSRDSIVFLRSRFQSNYDFIKLNCEDSTYQVYSHSEIEIPNGNGGLDTTYWAGTSNTTGGKWAFNPNTISFKPDMGNKWFHFTIENIGTKETNKKVIFYTFVICFVIHVFP